VRVVHRGAGRLAAAWVGVWGCGHGPVSKLAPQVRMVAGGMVLAACLLTPASSGGVGVLAVAMGGWVAACGVPWRVLRALVVMGGTAFMPLALVAGAGVVMGHWPDLGLSLALWGELLLRGVAVAAVATSTVAVLGVSELRGGLAALPVPRLVALIVLQIVHQTGALLEETARIAAAVAVRGAGRGGLRLLVSLPRVWLPRLLARAERVANAMEVRGVSEYDLARVGVRPAVLADRVALLAVAALVGLAAALRWGWTW